MTDYDEPLNDGLTLDERVRNHQIAMLKAEDRADLELGRLVRKMPPGSNLEHVLYEDGTTVYVSSIDFSESFTSSVCADTPDEALQKNIDFWLREKEGAQYTLEMDKAETPEGVSRPEP